MEDTITIVISAYRRRDALELALKSVLNQSNPHWKVIIVADCCDQEFVQYFQNIHPKVKVYNLPKRCGNQYGPNSVGLFLTDTKYLCFLNHDDILLSDHLNLAINTLQEKGAQLYLGTGANCHLKNQNKYLEEEERLVFSEKNRTYAIWRCITQSNIYFEPSSSIVVDTTLAKKAGYWCSPSETPHTPLLDWLSKLMQQRPIICTSDQVSTLKFNLHHTQGAGGDYSSNHFLDQIPFYIYNPPEETRKLIEEDLSLAAERDLTLKPKLAEPLDVQKESQLIIEFYNYLNGVPPTVKGKKKDMTEFFLKVIQNRTGEHLTHFQSASSIVEQFKYSYGLE